MSDVIPLPRDPISKTDRAALEHFAGHLVSRGRATRWHWQAHADGSPRLAIFVGGAREQLSALVERKSDQHEFVAWIGGLEPSRIPPGEAGSEVLAEGGLDHIMAELDTHFMRLHGELD